MDDFIHHIVHFLMYSLVIWQIVLGVYIILLWVKKNMGPIEVGVNKNLIVDTKSDESEVKLDEKIKGKVKTQKNKLRELRK